MSLFLELDPTTFSGGKITGIEPDSVAAEIGLQAGDELLAINDNQVQDVIDVQFYGAEESLELLIRRDGEMFLYEAERAYDQSLGLTFTHPTFDIDIRRCNNLCGFCFVLQMAPRFRRALYIKDDDYRYSFLFGHYVTLTNLSDHDWQRIQTMRLSPLYVSVHVTDGELRRQFLRNPTAPDILPQLRQLADWSIEMHTQLVIVSGFNDGRHLLQSLRDLESLWPAVQSISIVPVGLTSHHKYGMRPHTPAEAAAMLDDLAVWQSHYREQFGVAWVYPTDEWFLKSGRPFPPISAYDGQQLQENGLGLARQFLDEWEGVKAEIVNCESSIVNCERVTLVTGRMFAPVLRETAATFAQMTGVDVAVEAVANQVLGESITAAGLLMAGDILAHLEQADLGDLVVLPRVTFDHPNRISLDDIAPQTIANQLGRPVALADSMGDVWDAVTGVSQAMVFPKDEG